MDAAETKHARFGLPYKLLYQNEIVPFFMDEKRNVRWFSSPNKRMLANSSLPCYTSLIHQNKEERYCAYK